MSRIKAVAAFVLCLCLVAAPACAESPSLISEEMIKAETVNYETYTVETGTYEKEVTAQASEYYPYTYSLRYEGMTGKFVEYKVSRGDTVKAGDVLAVVAVQTDGVNLMSKQTELSRMKTELEEQTRLRREEIEEMLDGRAEIADPWQRELETLRIQRAQVALEQYTYQQERAIGMLEEEIAEIEEELSENTVVASIDGVIIDVVHKREGDRVYTNEVLVEMYSTDGMLLRIKNEYGDFRYGMKVQIAVGPVQSRTYLEGRVVGADTLIPEAERKGYAFVAIDTEFDPALKLTIPYVTAKTQYIENVMLVPKKGAKLEGGKYFVTKLTDGAVQKRFVNYVMQNVQHLWILQGLEPGETIIIE